MPLGKSDMIFSIFVLTLISSCSELFGLNTEIMRGTFDAWGPSARDCVRFAKNPKRIILHEQDVAQAVSLPTNNVSRLIDLNDQASHDIFVVRPSHDSRLLRTVEFGTNHLRKIVACAYAKLRHVERNSFYKTIRGNPLFRGPAGEMYKIHVLLWLLYALDEETLSCTGAMASFPKLKLPSCPKEPKFFSKPEELAGFSEPKKPKCLIPTFPTFDAIVLTSNAVITVQITISSTHDAKAKGFDLIYKNLPNALLKKRPKRYHLFITDRETNAKSLREQNRKEIPDKVCVYSTVITVEELESKVPVTYDRVNSLEEARVSTCCA
jgi:hypothetical protein